ncbi:MAG: dihydroorotase [Patescibacteria group bacterium]|nr:dihydroorotase [Patescibacteria group bacterium]
MFSIEGQIVSQGEVARRRVEIGPNGLIGAVTEPTGLADLVLDHELVFPGFIDLHVHARECVDHSQDYKEDFTTAGAAAVNGGVVAFADMPNNPAPPVDESSLAGKYRLVQKSAAQVLLYAGIGPGTRPLTKLVPYKVFMGKSVGELYFKTAADLETSISNYRGQRVSFHCEDPAVLAQNQSQPTHETRRPEQAEALAIELALKVIKKYQLQGKICHCSTAVGLSQIRAAKKQGLDVTVEVAPHHLYFDESMLNEQNRKMFQVNPPIRQARENRLALIQALREGDIDYLATDHAPHTLEEKQRGTSGMPHLDTYGPFAAWLMKEQKFTPQDIARVCSFNPGQFFGQFTDNKYGRIEPGFEGSLTVLDMQKPVTITKNMLKTKCGWSPFEGIKLPGSVTYTIIKGKVCKGN